MPSISSIFLATDPAQNQTDPVWNLPGMSEEEIKWVNFSLHLLAIAGGFLCVTSGYRLFLLSRFTAGYITGYFLCLAQLATRTMLQGWLVYVLSGGAALVCGFLFVAVRPLGVLTFGLLGGSLLGVLLLGSTPLTNLIPYNWISLAVILACGCVFAALSCWKEKLFLIIMTSYSGSFVMGTTISELAWQRSAMSLVEHIITAPVDHSYAFPTSDWHFYAIIGGVLGMTLLGVLFQYLVTARNYEYVPYKLRPTQSEDVELLSNAV